MKIPARNRHNQIRNPKGVKAVAIPTRRELLDRIKDLESDNEDMQERLEEIAGLAGEEEDEEEQGEE
jgi:hypothetical protein